MKLADYVKKRNGVPFGHPQSLRKNLQRSLGAKNFPSFWNYWNPIFSYHLGTKVFRPLKKVMPIALSLILTFLLCGLIHDIVTMLFRRKVSLFFTVWFLLMGSVVLIVKKYHYDLSKQHWIVRAITNVSIIASCLALTYYLGVHFQFC